MNKTTSKMKLSKTVTNVRAKKAFEKLGDCFTEAHGDKYDYSKVIYTNNTDKIEIICKKHGEFLQAPGEHKSGKGCSKCSGRNLTTKEIIQQFKKVHGDTYDYSKVEYKKATKNVIVLCEKHGEFLQSPSSHKNGHGCHKCSGKYIPTTKEIVQEFKEVHGDLYDYSKVIYKKGSNKVKIICKEHGEFLQAPSEHKRGKNCPKCSGSIPTTEKIIQQFKEVHGNRYEYSKVKYKKANEKITIICKVHGEFLQTHSNHRKGAGCPKCSGKHIPTTIELILNLDPKCNL